MTAIVAEAKANAKKLTKKFKYISRYTPAVIAECMRDYFVIFFVCG